MGSNIPAVADLVDLGSDHKRTLLPSTNDLNAPPTPTKPKEKEDAKQRYAACSFGVLPFLFLTTSSCSEPGQIQWIVAERDGNKDKEKEKEKEREKEKEKEKESEKSM